MQQRNHHTKKHESCQIGHLVNLTPKTLTFRELHQHPLHRRPDPKPEAFQFCSLAVQYSSWTAPVSYEELGECC